MVARELLFLCMLERTMPRRRERQPSLVSTGDQNTYRGTDWTDSVVGDITSNGKEYGNCRKTHMYRRCVWMRL